MPSSTAKASSTPFFPGAWPTASQEQHDEAHDADISSVSSHGSFAVPSSKDIRKARRRWTYAGPARSHGVPTYIPSPKGLGSGPVSPTAPNAANTSPLSENTVSTAKSSELNTPNLADWPTQLNGSRSLLLDNFPSLSPSATRFIKSPPFSRSTGAYKRHPRLLSTPSRPHHFPSPHLDPPLLNFIPGIPALQLPHPDISVDFSTREFASAHSPRGIYSPSGERINLSPSLTVSSVPSERDSPVLPPAIVECCLADDVIPPTQSPPPEMDAFALATAVASSVSRSSFSIPPSIQSVTALPATAEGTSSMPGVPQYGAYRRPSGASEATAGHHGQETSHLSDVSRAGKSLTALAPVPDESAERIRARRLSAPPPSNWQAPRLQPIRTISSRVDVGEDDFHRRMRAPRQPVLGKVRKLGERIRGLFKYKGSPPSKNETVRKETSPEYGLMTTTTAVTNVEYESEHPIPLPSPRARMMRNHRRSLPLPLLLPSTERVHTDVFSRLAHHIANDSNTNMASISSRKHVDLAGGREQAVTSTDRSDDPLSSPRTPKARRERAHATAQSGDDEQRARKGRRFSLSSALSRTKIDSLRHTLVPRPPLPPMPSHTQADVHGTVTQPHMVPSSSTSSKGMMEQQQYWGAELPAVQHDHEIHVTRSSSDLPPERSRTRTAPPQSPVRAVESDTLKGRRARRFSLSSVMAKRSIRSPTVPAGGSQSDRPQPSSPRKSRKPSRRRPRGDTVSTVTHGTVQFDMVAPRAGLDIGLCPSLLEVPTSQRSSMVSSVGGESTYYDAREQASDDDHLSVCSRRPDSDLDSMSFARTPDCSSGTFSFGSSTEREYYLEASDIYTSASYSYYRDGTRSLPGPSAMSQLVGGSSNTPITKTLRFSPSLTLSFDMSCSDFGDEDELGRLEREEDLSFMRALGFEFDEIARRVREEF